VATDLIGHLYRDTHDSYRPVASVGQKMLADAGWANATIEERIFLAGAFLSSAGLAAEPMQSRDAGFNVSGAPAWQDPHAKVLDNGDIMLYVWHHTAPFQASGTSFGSAPFRSYTRYCYRFSSEGYLMAKAGEERLEFKTNADRTYLHVPTPSSPSGGFQGPMGVFKGPNLPATLPKTPPTLPTSQTTPLGQ
jgi:hypothetical protein